MNLTSIRRPRRSRRFVAASLLALPFLAGSSSAVAGVDTWTPTGPNSTAVSAVAVSPDGQGLMAAGSFVFRSTDAGASWGQVGVGPGASSIVIDPADPSVVMVAWGTQASWRSTDGGATWASYLGPVGTDISIDPNDANSVFIDDINGTGIAYSGDMGATWHARPLPSGEPLSPVAFDPPTGDAYVGTTDGLMRTTDGGVTWTSVSAQLGNIRYLAFDPNNAGVVYAGTWNDGLYVSTDTGQTWTHVAALSATKVSDVSINAADSQTVIVSADGLVERTTDGGSSWSTVTGLPPIGASQITEDPNSADTAYATTPVGVYRSTDAGASFAPRNSGMVYGWFDSIAQAPSDAQTLYAASGEGGLFVSHNDATSWTQVNTGLPTWEATDVIVDPTDASTAFAIVDGSVYETTTGGASWAATALAATDANSLAIDSSGTHVYAATDASGVYASNDAGATWHPADTGLGSLHVTAIATDPSNPDTAYAAAQDEVLYRSIDDGTSWQPLPLDASGTIIQHIIVSPSDAATIYAGPWVSRDGGTTWLMTGAEPAAVDPSDPATVYILNNGVSVRVNHAYGQGQWYTLASIPSAIPNALLIDKAASGRLLIATTGGIFSEDMVTPTAAVDPATARSDGLAATLHGTIDGNGSGTTYEFQWGTTTDYDTTSSQIALGTLSGPTPVSITAYSLAPGTTYHYRLVAWNRGGATVSSDGTFRTPVPPSITAAPSAGFTRGGIANGAAPAKVRWDGTGGDDPICSYHLEQWINGGTAHHDQLPNPTVPAYPTTLTRGSATYSATVTDCTGEGTVFGTGQGPTQKIAFLSEANASLTHHGRWSRTTSSGDLGGAALTTTQAGAWAELTFTGSSIAWASTLSPTGGKVDVSIDGAPATTIDLNRPLTRHQHVVFAQTWPITGVHSIRITNVQGGNTATLDGLLLAH